MLSVLLAIALLFSSASYADSPHPPAPVGETGGCSGSSPADALATPNLRSLSETVGTLSKYYLQIGLTDDSWFRTNLLGGDNYGYAYGVHVVAGKNRADGTRISFSYSSDLYTAPVEYLGQNANGTYNEKQVFTNDNKYKVEFDNGNQRRTLYYKGVAGVQALNSQPSNNPLNASTQQLWFHRSTNNVRQLEDLGDGRPDRTGLMAGGDVGVQANRKWGPVALRARADGGGILSGVPGASYKNVEARAALRYQPGTVGVELAVELEGKFHPQGIERDTGVDLSLLLGHSLQIGGKYRRYGGTLDNYVLYNLPNIWTGKNDPTFTLWVRKSFGGQAGDAD